MPRIAAHTLGCKVNQYDTEAMVEAFERAGYDIVGMEDEADVYLINTCTVTGTGDQKSLKLIRRIHREHPDAAIVAAGCLAQRTPMALTLPGVKLIIGVQRRAEAAELTERAIAEDRLICAVEPLKDASFECLFVTRHEGKTRATMKIQEGCDRYCAYCVIPYVRGPVRSMPLASVAAEAKRLGAAGYREVVVTGIHLASYGRDTGDTLLSALAAVESAPGVERVRIGSLEPVIVTDDFARALGGMPKMCHQFHLSLQSGSKTVLRRMRRRYTPEEYLRACERLRAAMPNCALTTDVLTGFPGETEAEAAETLAFIENARLSRLHVFPYSKRQGTVADTLPDQVPEAVKRARAAKLILLGNKLETAFVQSFVGTCQTVLFETASPDGMAEGYTGEYVRVRAKACAGQLASVFIERAEGALAYGRLINENAGR